jgi:hypothetical protein
LSIKILSPVLLLGFPFLRYFSQNYLIVLYREILFREEHFYPQRIAPRHESFSRFKVVGGRLLVREANGNIRVLVDSTMNFNGISLVDVQDPCVYWDASKIIFSGVEHCDSSWRIYETALMARFKKITSSNRNIPLTQFGPIAYKFVKYDDIDPCYLPDGRIVLPVHDIQAFPRLTLQNN